MNQPKIVFMSTLTCPECGHSSVEKMPTNACQWFYECSQCGVLLKPLKGDRCVFCSYGSVKYLPIQDATAISESTYGCSSKNNT